MALDVRYQTWMGFKQKVGDVYFFEIRLCMYIELANYPLIQIGVARIPNDPEFLYTLAKALKEIPLSIPQNTNFPLVTGADDWDCPEDIKLDKVTAPAYVSDTDYTALSVFSWTTPSFWMSLCAYVSTEDASTEIPESVPNHDKMEVSDPNGTVFMPCKDQWWKSPDVVAVYTSFYGRTDAMFDGAFIWEGIDISEEIPPHIWWCYTAVYPFESRPRVSRPLTWRINLAPAWTRGFYNHYESSGSNYSLEQDRWVTSFPSMGFQFYPEVPPGGGGFPTGISVGVGLLGLLGLPGGGLGCPGVGRGTIDIVEFIKGG